MGLRLWETFHAVQEDTFFADKTALCRCIFTLKQVVSHLLLFLADPSKCRRNRIGMNHTLFGVAVLKVRHHQFTKAPRLF